MDTLEDLKQLPDCEEKTQLTAETMAALAVVDAERAAYKKPIQKPAAACARPSRGTTTAPQRKPESSDGGSDVPLAPHAIAGQEAAAADAKPFPAPASAASVPTAVTSTTTTIKTGKARDAAPAHAAAVAPAAAVAVSAKPHPAVAAPPAAEDRLRIVLWQQMLMIGVPTHGIYFGHSMPPTLPKTPKLNI